MKFSELDETKNSLVYGKLYFGDGTGERGFSVPTNEKGLVELTPQAVVNICTDMGYIFEGADGLVKRYEKLEP